MHKMITILEKIKKKKKIDIEKWFLKKWMGINR